MNIVIIGLNHKTAPLELREKLAFSERELREALDKLLQLKHIQEGLILSTCNRVEIYAVVNEREKGVLDLKQFLEDYHRVKCEEIEEHLYTYSQPKAISHLFQVAVSLDSMVVGETQILGQVKAAYSRALENGSTGKILNALFQKSFRVAKDIRTNTNIARSAVSISSVAVELANKIFGDISGKTVMIVGAGKMSEQAVDYLASSGASSILVANRTFSRAEEVAKKFRGRAVKFDRFLEEIVFSDIVISSTGAPHYVILKNDMLKTMSARRHRPI